MEGGGLQAKSGSSKLEHTQTSGRSHTSFKLAWYMQALRHPLALAAFDAISENSVTKGKVRAQTWGIIVVYLLK